MFNFRPSFPWLGFHVEPPVEEEVPGLHNWRPGEEAPGFRMNADSSVRQTAAPAAQLRTDVSGNPFGLFDLYGVDAFRPVGDGSPPPYLADAGKLYDRLGGAPTSDPDTVQPAGLTSFALAPSISSLPSYGGTGTDTFPVGVHCHHLS